MGQRAEEAEVGTPLREGPLDKTALLSEARGQGLPVLDGVELGDQTFSEPNIWEEVWVLWDPWFPFLEH